MPVRNGVLGRAVSAAAPQTITLATVPSTDTFIVKDVHVKNGSAMPANVQVQVVNAGAIIVAWLIDQTLIAGADATFSGFVCAGPTDQLHFFTDQNLVYCWVSGADLPGHI